MENDEQAVGIRPHHRQAIDALAERFRMDDDVLAVIIAGSVAQGTARADSDIDCYLVVTDEVFEARKREDRLFYYEREGCGYEGGYYDGKIITAGFLKAAAERGSEPTRASFAGSFAACSRIPGLSALLARIPVYPEESRTRNFSDFFAQVELYGDYFAKRALAHGNAYLLAHSVSQVALFAGRLILAYNRILFPCHKSLKGALERAGAKPGDYFKLQDAMLAAPAADTIDAFVACVRGFHDWGIGPNEAVSRFIVNNEWNWLDGEPPLADR